MNHPPATPDAFTHVRVILGFVISLSLARLLTGLARFVQHPGQARDPLHLLWAGAILLLLIRFWWWEFWLYAIPVWSFPVYLFLILFVMQLYLLTTLLFPDQIGEYRDYGDYFMNRRRWFFSLFAGVTGFDLIDTLLKGQAHVELYGIDYWIQAPLFIGLALIAIVTTSRRFHYGFVGAYLLYQLVFVASAFTVLS